MKWRRGTFTVNLEPWAIEMKKNPERDGWISEPFAVSERQDAYDRVILTHLPTGAVACRSGMFARPEKFTVAAAKKFAAMLLAKAGDHDWSGPKGANPKKKAPTMRSAWCRRGNEIFRQVFAEMNRPDA
jgi:hypothetical protein